MQGIESDDDDVIILEDFSTFKPKPQQKSVKRSLEPNNGLTTPSKKMNINVLTTPNIPKIRASFFNRKYRDLSNCQTTPATPKPQKPTSASIAARQRGLDVRQHSGSKEAKQNHKLSAKISKNIKANQNESITSDYSTPKTTRALVTPSTNSGGKLKRCRYHLIYKPLELDNESSSESNDIFRHKNEKPSAKSIETPLARC